MAKTSKEFLEGLAALADGEQATHQIAHHVVQEGICLELESPIASPAGDADVHQVLDR